MKKDAPSGTAKTLAEILKTARVSDDEISIQSIREGEVVGEHTVIFAGPGERLELVHRAKSRETFAKGCFSARRNGSSANRRALFDARCARVCNFRLLICGRRKMRVGVALGSNLGDRLDNLRAARKAIVDLAGVQPPILSSSIYETEPVDCEPGAAKFFNAVLEFDYDGDPADLLKNLSESRIAGAPARSCAQRFSPDRPRPSLRRRDEDRQ